MTTGTREDRIPGTSGDSLVTDPALRAVEDELVALFARSREHKRQAAASIHPSLQPAGYGVLRLLAGAGPSRASALAERLGVDRSAVTRLVQSLEDLGLVVRQQDAEDGRATLLDLSPAGRERMSALRQDHQAALHRLLADWPDEDVRRFAELLARFNAGDDAAGRRL
ncbi:MAG TPA: MarR family transcriptional regulator [Thermomicrobiales bacterium]|jgi:DNA-binding MarR family transcriptional regulator|nr:MarR family transcriptional regulator [Thermomicrobiales bacterium]